jgi:hypothetical protein
VEAIKALGSAFAEHSFFARPHYCAADLRTLLAAAGVDAVCERGGRKASYEKDQRNDYQQEEH